MAGVSFEKYKTSNKVKSILRHCDKEKRLATRVHSNEHIDKAKTVDNIQMGRDYKQSCEYYDKRQKWLANQPNANKRSDKVLCFGLEIPFPDGLSYDQQVDCMNRVTAIIAEMYGGENIVNAYMHVDEQHEYMDSEKKALRMSRVHGHVLVIPEMEGRLNGRDFSSRRNMKRLNNAIHTMCQEQYGLDFMDGTKSKSKDNVATLKLKSKIAEQQSKIAEQQSKITEQEDRITLLEAQIEGLQDKIKDLQVEELVTPLKRKIKRNTGNDIANVVKDTQEQLQKAAERWKDHLEERNSRAYEILSVRPEDYDSTEERSDEGLS